MPSAGTYRRSLDWATAEQATKRIDVGVEAERNPERATPLGVLRVGYQGADTQGRVLAVVSPADDGTIIGPLDLPFVLVLPQPMRVELSPVGPPASPIRVVASVCDVTSNQVGVEFANYTDLVPIANVLPLPQWVRQVNVIAPASAQFRTAGAVALGAAFSGVAARPSLAVELLMAAGGYVVLSY